jgi:hypothetical protein
MFFIGGTSGVVTLLNLEEIQLHHILLLRLFSSRPVKTIRMKEFTPNIPVASTRREGGPVLIG